MLVQRIIPNDERYEIEDAYRLAESLGIGSKTNEVVTA